jgi:hypothetical protein
VVSQRQGMPELAIWRIIIPCLECGLLWIRMVKLWSKEFYQK